ncbi:MAG: serine protease Do, partial [Gammaproteobacteria bacterium]
MSIKNNQHKFKENPKKLVLALLTAGIVSVGLIAMQSTTPALATSTDNFATQVFQSGFADLVEKVKPAVVNISTRSTASGNTADMRQFQFSNPRFREYFGQQFDDKKLKRKTRSLGSGFIIDHKGLVVTNYHVVAKADEIEVILDDGTKLPATLIGSDQKTDLALLKVEHDKPLPQVAFGDDDLSRVGDWVIAIGNPFGLGGTTTTGIISARGRNINSGPFDDF